MSTHFLHFTSGYAQVRPEVAVPRVVVEFTRLQRRFVSTLHSDLLLLGLLLVWRLYRRVNAR